MLTAKEMKVAAKLHTQHSVIRLFAGLGDLGAKIFVHKPIDDPYPLYAQIRDRGPLVKSRLGMYVTASNDVCNTILRDARFGTWRDVHELPDLGGTEAASEPPINPMHEAFISLDPPDHTRLRRSVQQYFTLRVMRNRAPGVEELANRLLDDVAGRDSFELMEAYAVRLPVAALSQLLGVPDSFRDQFLGWASVLGPALERGYTLESVHRLHGLLVDMEDFFTRLVAYRREHPGEDLVSKLVNEGDLERRDLLATIQILLLAGFGTTSNLIGNGTLALLSHPEVKQRMLDDPSTIDDIVEEALRYDSPAQAGVRITTEAVELAGVTLPKGTPVVLLLAAANRDPAVFTDPDRFDPDRPNLRDHIAFAAGIHFCIGAGFARMVGGIGIRTLFQRFPDLAVAGPILRRPTRNIRGMRSFPLRPGSIRPVAAETT